MGLLSFFGKSSTNNEALKSFVERGALIVDVRTPEEFRGGHVEGSVNIPLSALYARMNEIKDKKVPVITCCRSGARSGSAKSTLEKEGIEVINGGPWNSLAKML